MKVGIDITSIIYQRGVSRYTSNLVRSLAKCRDIQLSLYGSTLRQTAFLEKFARQLVADLPDAKSRVSWQFQKYPPTAQEWLWNLLHVNPIRKIFPQLAVFHSWDWLQPPDQDLPVVSTIHDLAILKFPETAHPRILRLHKHAWGELKKRSAQVIAVSHATKKDVVELLGFSPQNVHVVYEALPYEVVKTAEELSEEEYEKIRDRLRLGKPYILFVGTREPRKNLLRLIEAWQPLSKEVQLIVAGEKGWDESDQKTAILKNPELRFLGRVSDQELTVLYGEAEVFAYPSLYEGFGLPILEAFYHGTPVVTSNVSSMPEVAGNAAELVDPLSVKSIRTGIERVLKESTEEQQKRLQRMIIRRQLFSWTKVAEETVRVYQKASEA